MYIDLLLRWNARINLTAIRTPDEIVTRHFGESFFAARHLLTGTAPAGSTQAPLGDLSHNSVARKPRSGAPPGPPLPHLATPESTDPSQPTRALPVSTADRAPGSPASPSPASPPSLLLDLGSGAGFPGLPMKIWSPQTTVTLIESNHKKVAFLREVIRALTLTNINVFPGRAEDFPPATANLLTLRAVERFETILPTALTLLAPAARLALLIGEPQVTRAQALIPSLHWTPPIPVPQSTSRVLLIGNSYSHTPEPIE